MFLKSGLSKSCNLSLKIVGSTLFNLWHMHQAVKQLLEVNLGADTYRIAGKFGEDFNLAI